MNRRDFALALGASSLAATAATARAGQAREEDYAALAARFGFIGMAVGVAPKGRPSRTATAGLASVPFRAKVTPRTLFHIGSNTKHMTAMGVLRLAERGKLGLDKPVGDYLPDLPQAWRAVPVRALLNHTSGLPEYTDGFDWDRPYDHKAFLALFKDKPMRFERGTSWAYTNTNFVMAGWLIEQLAGTSFAAFLKAEFFTPAHLPTARVDEAETVIADRAEPYLITPEGLRHAVRMNSGVSGLPDGGVLFSADDGAAWARAMMSGALLGAESRKALVAPTVLSTGRVAPYGLGLMCERLKGCPFQHHGGGVPGFVSFHYLAPEAAVGTWVLTNSMGPGSGGVKYVGQRAAEAAAPGSTPLSLEPIADGDAALTREARAILFRGESPLDPDRLASEKRALIGGDDPTLQIPNLSERGAAQDFALVDEWSEGTGRLRRYRMRFADRTEHALLGYDSSGRLYWAGTL